jgi:hypothetical protein
VDAKPGGDLAITTASVPGSLAGCPHAAHLMSVASTWAAW